MKINLLSKWILSRFLLALSFGCALVTASAQVTLSGSSYAENFDGMGASGTTLPTGWTVRVGAGTSSRGTARTLVATTNIASTAGNFYNYPNGTGRCIGIRQTGSLGDPGASFELEISNTLGKTGFSLTLDHAIISSQARSTTWSVQYSTNGTSWVTLGTYADPGSAGSTTANYSLGTGLDNQSGTVYIRVVALTSSSGSGVRDSYGLDNVSLSWTNAASCSLPSDIVKNNITDSSVSISWTAATGSPTGYEYAVKTSSSDPVSGTSVGTTSASVSALNANTTYYVFVRTDCGGGTFSNWIKDSFNTLAACAAPAITSSPANETTCPGATTLFTISASGSTPAYQWQVNSGSGYADLSNNSTYFGAGSDSLMIITDSTLNGNMYRCIVTNACGSDTSGGATLAFYPTYSTNNPQTICAGTSYTFNGHTYSTAGNYIDTLQTVNGCDSIVVTQLTVNPTQSTNNPQTICEGSSYLFNGHTYNVAGNYNDTLQTVNGCDSIIVTQLTVNPTQSTNNPQTICEGGSYTFNGNTYSVAGNYMDTLQTINGCDSIVVTQLTVNPVYSINNPQAVCAGSSYTFNGHTYSVAGNYMDTLQTVNGCDSIIVTQLTVNPVSSINNPQAICNGSSYTINGHTYTTAGTYNDTLQSVGGCDSIIVTQITVTTSYNLNNPQAICTGGSYIINGHTYTTAGTYSDTLQSVGGCDSIIVTQLTVNSLYNINNPQVICAGGSYVINGHTYTIAGNYNDTLQSIGGCDSIIVTQLSVNPTYSVNNPQTICAGGSYTFNGHAYSTAGNYNDTLHAITGCDSIIVTQLTVNPTYSVNNPQTICAGGSYTFNGHTYSTAGNYNDTLHAITGCDSIIVTQLMVNPILAITQQPVNQVVCGDSAILHISATGTNITYQWIATDGGMVANDSIAVHGGFPLTSPTLKSYFDRQYVCQVNSTCGSALSDTIRITSFTNTWTGALSSDANNPANWACNRVPGSATPKNLVVPKTAVNNLNITGSFAFTYVDIDSGKTVMLNGLNDTLIVNEAISVASTGHYNGAYGTTRILSTSPGIMPGGTFYNLQLTGAFQSFGEEVVIKNQVVSQGIIRTSAEFIIDSNATYTIPGVVTEGSSGKLTIRNIGTGGRTGAVVFPVAAVLGGNNAVELTNTGTADAFSIQVTDSVADAYTGNTLTGSRITSGAVNKTWFISEAVAGGSNVQVKLQWNASEELPGFNRSASYVGHYSGTTWMGGTATAASGTDPYTQTVTGVTSFSPFGVGSNGTLPVKFASVKAAEQGNDVEVTWTTASEQNNDHFIVERSTDGQAFIPVSEPVKGAANSSGLQRYSFIDANAARASATRLLYRIQQVDANGRNSYSNVVAVTRTLGNKEADATVYPNPSTPGHGTLAYSVPAKGMMNIVLYSIRGEQVAVLSNEEVAEGDYRISLPELPAGVYFVKLAGATGTQVIRFVVN